MSTNRNEAHTRKDLIDPAITKAGWDLKDPNQVRFEIPVAGEDAEPWDGVTDYTLYRQNGEVLAVIEAKRQSKAPQLAEQQAIHYLNEIEKKQSFRPFAFLTNGNEIFFHEKGVIRQVYGFFSYLDLERMLSIRQNQQPLSQTKINTDIVNRPYQLEAIKRIGETFDQGARKALLVMATGTGKTRTAMGLIDVFMKARQAQNILFVADRDALVTQAIYEGFQAHIPNEPCARLYGATMTKPKSQRLFAVTLQTLSNVFQQLTPSYFDLIIFDEVHRSIFNKYSAVLRYFDSRMIGLTATPAQFIDRDTFVSFDCFNNTPTALYTYDQAIEEGYLVDYRVYRAETNFQDLGIHGNLLTEEQQNQLIEEGYDPDEFDYAGTDLEKKISNTDTLRQQWEEIMEVCLRDESGQLPAKTIIFAMTQDHALRLASTFHQMFPQWPELVKVITHQSEYRGQLIETFKKESMPRIAISVDMLETGVNVPEVCNIVFLRSVQSPIKLQQMIGRGTRNHEACRHPEWLPDGQKNDFLIIDFWENDFNRTISPDAPAQTLPIAVRVFRTRLQLLEHYLQDQSNPDCQRLISQIRQQIGTIPRDDFSVKKAFHLIGEAWEDGFWRYITPAKINLLRMNIAPLLRFVAGVDVAAETFAHKIERFKLKRLSGEKIGSEIDSIRTDIDNLPDFVFQNRSHRVNLRDMVFSRDFEMATQAELDELIDEFANQMRHRRQIQMGIVQVDLSDFITKRGFVVLEETGEEIYVEEYRNRVEAAVVDRVTHNPLIQRIQAGQSFSEWELVELERMLRAELAPPPIGLTDRTFKQAYGAQINNFLALIRQILELEIPDYREIVRQQFEGYIAQSENHFTAQQILFIRTIQSVLAQRHHLDTHDLFEHPFTTFGQEAFERLFTSAQKQSIIELIEQLAA